MKVTKSGKVRIEANEVRIGNFFVKRDSEQMKLTDLNGVFHHAVGRRMPIGIWLENIWARAMNAEEDAMNTLKVYIGTMWSLFSVAPDDEFISEVLRIAKEALERHPDWYGYNPTDDDVENDKALQEVRDMKEFEDNVKALAEKEATDGEEETGKAED